MFWIIALIVGVLLLVNATDRERVTGKSNALGRYAALAIIGFSAGSLFTLVFGGLT